ncbi:MAG: 1-(5-phosphoribosyl)-5-[(5-phosphoribosylamino)methylideneamino]imidazole-4-carboxamide isomerase [Phocaeicola sp.]
MIELIPAIDIIDGKCVRLSQGDYATQKIYNESPLEVAKEFEAHGIHRLHIVDLDGAASHHIVNYQILEQIAVRTSLIIDFGGGIKSSEDLQIAFNSGAEMVTLGSVAVKQPDLFLSWLEKFGSERIILGADVNEKRIAVQGWLEDSGEELLPFLHKYTKEGIHKVLCTDIKCDGMLQGPSIELYKEVMKEFPYMHLIASGGVSGIQDLIDLEKAGIPAVVFGKAIYEGKITMKELATLF